MKRSNTATMVVLCCLTAFWVVGCRPAATTPPEVSETFPLVGAIGVAVDTLVTAAFTKDMEPSTITTDSFALENDSGAVDGTVAYNEENRTATFTPLADLAPDTEYTATLTVAMTDINGLSLEQEYTWSFTTTSPSIAYQVSTTLPEADAVGVATDTLVTATFNKDMDSSTITADSFTLESASAGVDGTVAYSDKTATLTPSADLAYDTVFTASLTTVVTDEDGLSLEQDYVWSFTTGGEPDTTPPTVQSVTPGQGEEDVPLGSVVTVVFSELVDPDTVTEASFVVDLGAGIVIPGTRAAGATNDIMVFTPGVGLPIHGLCTVTLTAAITDVAGNPLDPQAVSFTTVDGAWGAALLVGTDATQGSPSPDVAFDDAGKACVIWNKEAGTSYEPWYNRYDGTAWLGETQMWDQNGPEPADPRISSGFGGNAMAVWGKRHSDWLYVYAFSFDGSGWTTPTDNNDYISLAGGNAQIPDLVVDPAGNAMLVWRQENDGSYSLYAKGYDILEGWDDFGTISHSYEGAWQIASIQIVGDGDSNVFVVWEQSPEGTYVAANRFNMAMGEWKDTPGVNLSGGPGYDPHIGPDFGGNAIAVWVADGGGYDEIWSKRWDSDTEDWDTTASKVSDAVSSMSNAAAPRIAVTPNGDAVAVWQQMGIDGVFANLYDVQTGVWQTPIQISTVNSPPQIATDLCGNMIVVWVEGTAVRGSRYEAGAAWEAGSLVAEDLATGAPDPGSLTAATGPYGKAIVVWGDFPDIRAIMFE